MHLPSYSKLKRWLRHYNWSLVIFVLQEFFQAKKFPVTFSNGKTRNVLMNVDISGNRFSLKYCHVLVIQKSIRSEKN